MQASRIEDHFTSNFVKGKFNYNLRVLLCCLPCCLVILGLGGRIASTTLILGLISAWLFELSGIKEGPFISLWATLGIIEVELMLSCVYMLKSSLFNIFFLFNVALFMLLLGIWGSLQFEWLQESSPIISLVMERILVSTLFAPVSIILTWTTVLISGIDNAPIYLCIYLYITFISFGLPMQSSFRTLGTEIPKGTVGYSSKSKQRAEATYICTKVENALHTMTLLLLPLFFHVTIYWRVIFSGWYHITNLLIIACLPVLLLRFTMKKDPLWWTGLTTEDIQVYEGTISVLVLIILVACFEYRVIFTSFYYSISMALFPPWNYIFVTLGLYSVVALIASHFMGYIQSLSEPICRGLSLGAALAASFVVGVPWYFIPFPLLAANSLVTFYFKKNIKDYLLFVFASAIVLFWFMSKSFMFLKFRFAYSNLTLSQFILILCFFFIFSMLLPGVFIVNISKELNGLFLCIHTALLLVGERALYDEGMYPYYLVLFTTAVGMALTFRLEHEKRLDNASVWNWMIISMYSSKLAPLVDINSSLSSFLLVLAMSSYYFMAPSKMSIQQGLIHGVSIGVVAFATQNTVLSKIYLLLAQHQPTSGISFACFLIVWGIGLLPLSFKYFKHLSLMKSINILVLSAGMLFFLLQPELSAVQGTHQLSYELSPRWPQFLLYGFIVLTIASATGIIPVSKSQRARVGYVVAAGFSLGLYICVSYVTRQEPAIMALFVAILSAVMFILLFTQWPTSATVHWIPVIYMLFEGLLPLALIIQKQTFDTYLARKRQELIMNGYITVLGLYAASNLLIAVLMKLKQSTLSRPKNVKRAPMSSPHTAKTQTPDLEWIPYIGNISAVLSVLTSLYLSIGFLNGSALSIFVTVPILLLLNPTPRGFFSKLNVDNRYWPLVSATAIFLTYDALHKMIFTNILPSSITNPSFLDVATTYDTSFFGLDFWSTEVDWTVFLVGKNLLLLGLSLPTHYYFMRYTYDWTRQEDFLWTLIAPVNILGVVFGDALAIRLLGLTGLVYTALRYFVHKSIQQRGKQII